MVDVMMCWCGVGNVCYRLCCARVAASSSRQCYLVVHGAAWEAGALRAAAGLLGSRSCVTLLLHAQNFEGKSFFVQLEQLVYYGITACSRSGVSMEV